MNRDAEKFKMKSVNDAHTAPAISDAMEPLVQA
jgi:hypothetical protein